MSTPGAQVTIVECFHQCQAIQFGSRFEAIQKRFRFTLEALLDGGKIVFIGEEAKQEITTTAAQIAKVRGIEYLNIDIPSEIQGKICHVSPKPYPDDETGTLIDPSDSNPYCKAWNLVREYHMYCMYCTALTRIGVGGTLLIVGQVHAKPIANLLRSRSFDVKCVPFLYETGERQPE